MYTRDKIRGIVAGMLALALVIGALLIRRYHSAVGGTPTKHGDANVIVALPYFAMALMFAFAALLGASAGHLRVMFHFWKSKDQNEPGGPPKT